MNIGRNALINVAAIVLAVSGSASMAGTLEDVKSSGKISIAVAIDPPATIMNENGELSGAVPDVLKATIAKMGVSEVDPNLTEWGAMIPGLQARRFDVIATGLFVRPDRCEAVLFSQPDICAVDAFAVMADNMNPPKNLEEIAKDSTIKVGMCGGCAVEKQALSVGVTRDQIVNIGDPLGGLELLTSGRVQVVAYPDYSLKSAVNNRGDNEVKVVPVKGGKVKCSAVAFRTTDVDFRDAYDVALAEIKTSGEFQKILESYGYNASTVMATTREQLCGGSN